MHIGFAGLGNMGQAMARNIVRSGNQLTVYNRTPKSAEALAREGASIAENPADAAGGEIVITMLADDKAVESVVLGEHGLVEGMQSGSLHISMSTISTELSQRLAAVHEKRGQQYVSAPVFGRPEAAAAAKLFIVAAGPKNALAKAQPVFDVLGQRTFVVGERPEHANLVKLLGNFEIACVLESLGEVFAVARKGGVDPNTVFGVLSETLFGAPVFKTYGPIIIEEKFSPPGFQLPLGFKDLRLVMQAAEKLSAAMPFANVIRDRYLTAMANGLGDLDWSAISMGAAQSAGLPSRTREERSKSA